MTTDERRITELVSTWMDATRRGDFATVLSLMTEDVVFLRPGQPPLRGRQAFAASLSGSGPMPLFDGQSEIQEIQVLGDWAWLWSRLEVTATFPGKAPVRRSGHTLTVLRREAGKWRLARDANLLGAPEPG